MNLGEVLLSARTASRISLDNLASITSIRQGLLTEMEANNFAHCGGDIYARGHLRNIAPHIGLDPQHLIDLYNEEHSSESRSINEMLVENNVTRVPHEKKNLSWKVPAAFSIMIVVVLAVIQIVVTNVNSGTPSATKPTPVASATAEPTATPSSDATTTPTTGGVQMSITASRGNSLIDIVVDGQHVEKGSIFQGESKTFAATTSISIYFSNPAGLDVTVNGELLAPLGGQNEEVRRTFR